VSSRWAERSPLVDRTGRRHSYLRLSVTDRCNQRCAYCMPEAGVPAKSHHDILRFEETLELVRLFVELGVRRVRITGGEPLVRRGVERFIQALGAMEGLEEISLTTNGTLLAGRAQLLAEAGLHRVNVSLDSLRPERYARITRGGELGAALSGIQAARAAGLTPVKLNTVVLPDLEPDEARELILWCSQAPEHFVPRFIERMPFENIAAAGTSLAELQRALQRQFALEPEDHAVGDGPARYFRVAESGLRVGFIAPLTHHFCARCNRLRLTADGRLVTCLGHKAGISLRDLLRGGASRDALVDAIGETIWSKAGGHACAVDNENAFPNTMPEMGG
jgi:cyclic pyranopterin phosphate synthase